MQDMLFLYRFVTVSVTWESLVLYRMPYAMHWSPPNLQVDSSFVKELPLNSLMKSNVTCNVTNE